MSILGNADVFMKLRTINAVSKLAVTERVYLGIGLRLLVVMGSQPAPRRESPLEEDL